MYFLSLFASSIIHLFYVLYKFLHYCSLRPLFYLVTKFFHVKFVGFRSEQLKVYINCFGTSITIHGERPLHGNLWKRFSKKINISNNYSTDEIRSKFVNGILFLTMPKKVPLLKALQQLGRGKGSLLHMKMGVDVVLKIVTAVTVGVALGAYLTCKYSKPSHAEN